MGRFITVNIPKEKGPEAIPVELGINPSRPLRVRAWCTQAKEKEAGNIYLFEGAPSRAQCEKLLEQEGPIECILAVPVNAVASRVIELDAQMLTVFVAAKNESGEGQTVCFEVEEC